MNFLHKHIVRITQIVFFCLYYCSVGSMDALHPWQVGFQDPATPIMEGIIFFKGLLTLLEPQSRFGDELLRI